MQLRRAEGDFATASLLALFERQAQEAKSGTDWIPDSDAQDTVRTNIFYDLARTMNRYAGHPYDNLPS
jgi:hypothetical protein